ncbi:MAG: radical SAM family heme chaperone HemW [Xenococcaceae cyanobacterium]
MLSSKLLAHSPQSAYLHIPFCKRRCYYCDFPISVVGDKFTSKGAFISIERYLEMLSQEIEHTNSQGQSLQTIFFGGGTPSLLSVEQLTKILQTLDRYLGIATDAEISMEIDPATFDRVKLEGFYQAGITRVSLGVQAFQDELLKICGRTHLRQDIYEAVKIIDRIGFSNVSLDLISGLPQQTLAQWEESLQAAIDLFPQHISCYDLVLESVTAFGKQYRSGEKPLPDDETTAQMYRLAQQKLTAAGYEHYEISNYAQPGFQCRHNRVYWENKPFYGFGMGAASFVEDKRFTRPRTRQEYYEWVEKGCFVDQPARSLEDELLEKLMLGLRLAEGVSLSQISQQFGKEIVEKIWVCLQPYSRQGWVDFMATERVKLSDPDGFLFSNTILATLFDRLSG